MSIDDDSTNQAQIGLVDWRQLGEFAPQVPHAPQPARCDLGPGGSLLQDAARARHRRRPHRRLSIPASVLQRRPVAESRLLDRARAEQRIAHDLEPLTASGWVLFHDRVLPGGNHRLAHLAIGPAGVFLLTPIPDMGPLHIVGEPTARDDADDDGRQLYAGQLHLGPWLATRRWELEQLEPAIAAALQDTVWSGPTASLAVLAPPTRWWSPHPRRDTAVPDLPYEWRGVLFRPAPALVETLTGLPSPLDRPAVATLAAAVEQLCPPAGRPDQPD